MSAGNALEQFEVEFDNGGEARHLEVVPELVLPAHEVQLKQWAGTLCMDSDESVTGSSFASYGYPYPHPSSWGSGKLKGQQIGK